MRTINDHLHSLVVAAEESTYGIRSLVPRPFPFPSFPVGGKGKGQGTALTRNWTKANHEKDIPFSYKYMQCHVHNNDIILLQCKNY